MPGAVKMHRTASSKEAWICTLSGTRPASSLGPVACSLAISRLTRSMSSSSAVMASWRSFVVISRVESRNWARVTSSRSAALYSWKLTLVNSLRKVLREDAQSIRCFTGESLGVHPIIAYGASAAPSVASKRTSRMQGFAASRTLAPARKSSSRDAPGCRTCSATSFSPLLSTTTFTARGVSSAATIADLIDSSTSNMASLPPTATPNIAARCGRQLVRRKTPG
mmetsp:Transcript_92875/g.277120  ORF Transcript_92875/g.277120 Transcript_92875/m.277120 type:complete len:224 (+) Transcript_92875:1028-1699(+)